jgi:hypothetical protein
MAGQELVPARAGTASSLVMGLGWGLAGVALIGFGSLADLITVPRALDLAALVPLVTVVMAWALPSVMARSHDTVSSTGDLSLQEG